MPAPPDRRARDAYTAGLRLLAGRDLPASRVRERLGRRFEPCEVEQALARLQQQGLLDDRRAAIVYSRTALRVKHRGPDRIARELAAMGIDGETAREALEQALAEVDTQALLERALERRLRGRPIASPAEFRRHYAALVRLGFPPQDVLRLLKRTPNR